MFLYKYLSVIAIFIFRFCNSSVCMFCLASSRLPFILPANRHCHRYSDAQCVQCVHCEFHNSLSLFCPGLLCSVCRFAGERVQIALNSKHQTEAPEGRHGSLSLGAMTLVQSLKRTTFSTLPDVLGGNRIRFTTSAESLPSHRASLPSYLPFIMKNAEKCSQQSEKFDIILVSVCVCESAGDFHLALPIDSLHFPLFHHIYIGWGLNTLYNPADDIWSNCSNAVSNQPPRFFLSRHLMISNECRCVCRKYFTFITQYFWHMPFQESVEYHCFEHTEHISLNNHKKISANTLIFGSISFRTHR